MCKCTRPEEISDTDNFLYVGADAMWEGCIGAPLCFRGVPMTWFSF